MSAPHESHSTWDHSQMVKDGTWKLMSCAQCDTYYIDNTTNSQDKACKVQGAVITPQDNKIDQEKILTLLYDMGLRGLTQKQRDIVEKFCNGL